MLKTYGNEILLFETYIEKEIQWETDIDDAIILQFNVHLTTLYGIINAARNDW